MQSKIFNSELMVHHTSTSLLFFQVCYSVKSVKNKTLIEFSKILTYIMNRKKAIYCLHFTIKSETYWNKRVAKMQECHSLQGQ